jgi:hypothetical protein
MLIRLQVLGLVSSTIIESKVRSKGLLFFFRYFFSLVYFVFVSLPAQSCSGCRMCSANLILSSETVPEPLCAAQGPLRL